MTKKTVNKLKFIGLTIILLGLFIFGFIIGVKREKKKHTDSSDNDVDVSTPMSGIDDSVKYSEQLGRLHSEYTEESRRLRSESESAADLIRGQCGAAIDYIEQLRRVYSTNKD